MIKKLPFLYKLLLFLWQKVHNGNYSAVVRMV